MARRVAHEGIAGARMPVLRPGLLHGAVHGFPGGPGEVPRQPC
ncbi:MAG: hypothetical protein ABI831_28265 [Betaproteobacteria bacterium]